MPEGLLARAQSMQAAWPTQLNFSTPGAHDWAGLRDGGGASVGGEVTQGMGTDDQSADGVVISSLMIELTEAELDLLIHAAALGSASLGGDDKDRMRDMLRRLKGVLDGSA